MVSDQVDFEKQVFKSRSEAAAVVTGYARRPVVDPTIYLRCAYLLFGSFHSRINYI